MPSVTSEQLRLFKQRRAGALVVEVAALVLAPVSAVAVLVSFGEQGPASRIAAAITLFAVFFLGQFARHALFRRPVCGAPFPVALDIPRSVPSRARTATAATPSSPAERSMPNPLLAVPIAACSGFSVR